MKCPQLNQSAREGVKWRLSQSLWLSRGRCAHDDEEDASASLIRSLCAGLCVCETEMERGRKKKREDNTVVSTQLSF